MLLSWIMCGLMILLALWFVLLPLFAHAEGRKVDEVRAANVLIYQDECQELDTDLHNGLIGEEEYLKEKQELLRRLLADTETALRGRGDRLWACDNVEWPRRQPLDRLCRSPGFVQRPAPRRQAHGSGQSSFANRAKK